MARRGLGIRQGRTDASGGRYFSPYPVPEQIRVASLIVDPFHTRQSVNLAWFWSRLIISYYRDPKSDDKKLSEIKEINYDIKSIKKRTFSTSKDSQENNFSEKEKISFDIFFKCQNCGKEIQITEIAVNLENKLKSSLMICPECNKYSEAKSHAVYGHEKYEFNLYSPLKLLDIAKEILNEYGVRIDLEELRQKYNSFFWSCVLYFSLNGLSFEMLLKYKTNEVSKENIKIEKEKEKVIQKKKKKVFKILEIQSQKNEI